MLLEVLPELHEEPLEPTQRPVSTKIMNFVFLALPFGSVFAMLSAGGLEKQLRFSVLFEAVSRAVFY